MERKRDGFPMRPAVVAEVGRVMEVRSYGPFAEEREVFLVCFLSEEDIARVNELEELARERERW